MLKNVVAKALIAIGSLVAGGASVGCLLLFIDEPNMPNNLIEK